LGYLPSLVLAVLQGLTEFLPVSSSGHLALAQIFLPGFRPDLAFDVLLHVATLVAVLVYFRADILGLARGLRHPSEPGDGSSIFAGCERRTVGLILVGTVATAAVGLALEETAEGAFHSPAAVGVCLLITAGLLALSGRFREGAGSLRDFPWAFALLVGAVQGLAVFPGLSRSGATIVACLLLGLDRRVAVPFSLLLSVPAIAGAFVLKIGDLELSAAGWGPPLVAFPVAAVVGYFCIHLLVKSVRDVWFQHFAWYCAALGGAALLAALYL